MRHSVQCSSVTTDFPHGQIVLLRRNRQVSAILMISYQECVPLSVNTDDHMTQVLSGFIPTSMLYFLEGSYCAQLTLKNCRTLMHLQEDRGETQIFAVLQRSLFYLFIYLYQCRLTDIDFIVYIIIQCSMIHFVAQIISSLASSSYFHWYLSSFDMPQYCKYFKNYIIPQNMLIWYNS